MQLGEAILLSDKVNLKSKLIRNGKNVQYILEVGKIQQEQFQILMHQSWYKQFLKIKNLIYKDRQIIIKSSQYSRKNNQRSDKIKK